MKFRYVDFYLLILVSLCVVIFGITGCGEDDDNAEPIPRNPTMQKERRTGVLDLSTSNDE